MEKTALTLDPVYNEELRAIRRWIGQQRKITAPGRAGATGGGSAQDQPLLARLDSWLLDDEQRQALAGSPESIFLLHAAACLGDIAVDCGSDPAPDRGLAQRTEDGVSTSWQAMGIGDAARARRLARLCARTVSICGADIRTPGSGTGSTDRGDIDIEFLAGCLALSRAIELKAPMTLGDITGHLPVAEAGLERPLHEWFEVIHIGPHPYLPATVQVKLSCRHAEVHRALKHHESQVRDLLHRLNQHIRPRFLFSDLIYEITAENYRPVDLKFSVDSSAALKLFTGQRLYADKRVFLRELIQNALDACSLRQLSETGYAPHISITFNDDISIIEVRDNGIGMDRQWLEKYFLSIGISFYRSSAIRDINRDANIDIGFISQFGIGFLSSFLVAEKIVIKTRKQGARGMRVTIKGLKDYFDVRPLEDAHPVGTHVALHLKPSKINFCRSLEYVGYLKTNIRFLQVPVQFTDQRGETTTIGRAPLSYAAVRSAPTDFTAPLEFQNSQGYLYLGTKMHTDHIFALESAKGGVSLFQDGIFVTHEETLLPEGARHHVIGRINLRGSDKCELSMDRNRIFWTGKRKQAVQQAIRHGLADLANRVIQSMQRQGVTGNTFNSMVNHLAVFFDFSDVDDRMHQVLAEPIRRIVEKRFKDFIRIHFAHTRRSEGIPEADGYNESWQRRILASFVHRN